MACGGVWWDGGMSTEATQRQRKHPRPTVVTLSCVFIAVTAFLTLTDLITGLMDWGTVDMQDALKPMVRELHRAGLDASMSELLRILRWVSLGMIVFVVSMLVFSIYAFRGDRSARIFTTVFAAGAGVISLTLGVVGILQAAMLFVAAGALWSPTANRWWRDEPEVTASDFTAPAVPLLGPPPPALPESTQKPPVEQAGLQQVTSERPASVLTAGLVTILGSLAAGGFAILYLGVYTFARSAYIDAFNEGPFKGMVTGAELELIMQVTLWFSIALLPLAMAGLVGAVALLSRRRVGRLATLVWAWIAGLIGLLMFPIGLLATAGAGTVIVLLLRDDARAWTGAPR
jgi:hypothetical protein